MKTSILFKKKMAIACHKWQLFMIDRALAKHMLPIKALRVL